MTTIFPGNAGLISRPSDLIGFNYTDRDAVQSVAGTSTPADYFIRSIKNALKVGATSIQLGGGTLLGVPTEADRDGWAYQETMMAPFRDKIIITILNRNECLLAFDRNSRDMIRSTVLKLAKMGVNRITNFHGLNDADLFEEIAAACHEARDQGYQIYAQAAFCVEDSPNPFLTREHAYRVFDRLLNKNKYKHHGMYVKNASGWYQPDDMGEMARGLTERFDHTLTMHTHDTYGLGHAMYLAGFEGGAHEADVQRLGLGGNVSQPDALTMHSILAGHKTLGHRAPNINIDAMLADSLETLAWRFRFRGTEARFDWELSHLMGKARVPGGASATLWGKKGPEAQLSAVLGTTSRSEILKAVCRMMIKISPMLGDPTEVTPYAKMVMDQAVQEIIWQHQGKPPFHVILPATQGYMKGKLGHVINIADVLRARVGAVEPLIPAHELPSGMERGRRLLEARNVTVFTEDDVILAGQLFRGGIDGDVGALFVQRKQNGTLNPPALPAWPHYLDPKNAPKERLSTAQTPQEYDYLVAQALGGAAGLERLAQMTIEVEKHAQKVLMPERRARALTAMNAAEENVKAFETLEKRVSKIEGTISKIVQATTKETFDEGVAEIRNLAGNDKLKSIQGLKTVDGIVTKIVKIADKYENFGEFAVLLHNIILRHANSEELDQVLNEVPAAMPQIMQILPAVQALVKTAKDELEKAGERHAEATEYDGHFKATIPEATRRAVGINVDSLLPRSAESLARDEYLHACWAAEEKKAQAYLGQVLNVDLPKNLEIAGCARHQAFAVHEAIKRVVKDVCAAKGVTPGFVPQVDFEVLVKALPKDEAHISFVGLARAFTGAQNDMLAHTGEAYKPASPANGHYGVNGHVHEGLETDEIPAQSANSALTAGL